MTLKSRITDDMKQAMKARETARLGALRLLLAAIQQKEIDERVELDDAAVLGVIDKMLKQRRDSLSQYAQAGRQDLAAIEQLEIEVISAYKPADLSSAQIEVLIEEARAACQASGPRDMGAVMAWLKPRLAGRADMGQVSARVKAALSA